MLSGLSIFCCGKSRMHSREKRSMSVCCVNLMVGTMQFFTVTFFLVGWAWSLVWGIYMIILAGNKSHRSSLLHFFQLFFTVRCYAERGYASASPLLRCFSARLEQSTSNIISRPNSLRPLLWHANMGDLVQWEHPQNYGAIGVGAHKTSKISETVQDRTKVTITD